MKHSPIEMEYPLTPGQAGLVYDSILAGNTGAYVQQWDCKLTGKLVPELFQRAWEQTIEIHPILRTAILHTGRDGWMQAVHRRVSLPWKFEDWSEQSASAIDRRVEEYLASDRALGFDLQTAPLMRLLVARTGEEEHRILWSIHHAIIDGWSTSIVLKNVFSVHRALREGQNIYLEPPRPFEDYVKFISGREGGQAKAYWSQLLDGLDSSEFLPRMGHDRVASFAPGVTEVMLDRNLTDRALALARQERTTLNVVIQALWALLLSRYADRDDVVYGLTVSGRALPLDGITEMVGLFLNTLPVRARVGENDSFLSLLKKIHSQQEKLTELTETALSDIKTWSGVPQEFPLFDSVLVFDDFGLHGGWGAVDDELSIVNSTFLGQTTYPLTVVVINLSDKLLFRFCFNAIMFTGSQMERLGMHLRTLCENTTNQAGQPMGNLRILNDAEEYQLTAGLNRNRRAYPETATIPELFDKMALIHPEKSAVKGEGSEITYAQLNERATQLATYLKTVGVGRGDRVALCLPNTIELVVAMLGVLKASAVYVALDPEHPPQHISTVLAETNAFVVLTLAEVADALPAHWGPVVCMDVDWAKVCADTDASVANEPPYPELACLMCTSGTTGKPKIVAIPHRAILRLVCNSDFVSFETDDVMAQHSNVAFDAVSFEVWGPLLNGATIVMFRRDQTLNAETFAELLQKEKISILFLTTAQFNYLASSAPAMFQPLRCLLFGGEAVNPRWVQAVLANGPPQRLLHVYGPTENTTFSTWHEVNTVDLTDSTVPIGTPIANSTAYVLDRAMRPMPRVAVGELYLGGDGLACGYDNDPELTREKFVRNPFASGLDERLYRTGDRVRLNDRKLIEFVGRKDNQVKLRGFRIELDGIKTILTKLAGVRSSAVVLLGSDSDTQSLVAFVVKDPVARALNTEDVISFLRERLPEFMVPRICFVDSLPLDANGKLNVRKLQQMESHQASGTDRRRDPQSRTEHRVARIWQEILNIQSCNVEETFFDLGGHSLLVLKTIELLRKEFTIDLNVADLFKYPTVAALARHLDRRSPPHRDAQSPSIAREESPANT